MSLTSTVKFSKTGDFFVYSKENFMLKCQFYDAIKIEIK